MSGKTKRILVLYWHPEAIETMRVGIRQHLGFLEGCDQEHELLYFNSFNTSLPRGIENLHFDAVVLHNLFLCMRWAHFYSTWKGGYTWLAELKCPKIAMPQDEYDHAEVLDEWLYELGVDVILSNFDDPAVLKRLYPIMHSRAKFYQVLTGYLDDTLVDLYRTRVRPIKERPLDVVYRASHLPYWFGSHGQRKWQVGARVDRRARALGMKSNISTHPQDVITGYQWLDFLASSRAITGCEGGSSVIDRRGEYKAQIEEMLRRQPGLSFDQVSSHFPADWDDDLLPLIGPRHLEAAMTRTCQILLEGRFVGVLETNRHYIPIKRDYSNLDEVLERLRDHESIQAMVDRAFEEICLSGRYSRKVLGRTVEEAIESLGKPPSPLVAAVRHFTWRWRKRIGPEACSRVDLKVPPGELAQLGAPYMPVPLGPPDLVDEEPATAPPSAETPSLNRTPVPTENLDAEKAPGLLAGRADSVVILDGESPEDARRWEPLARFFGARLPVCRLRPLPGVGHSMVEMEIQSDTSPRTLLVPSQGNGHHALVAAAFQEALRKAGIVHPLLLTDQLAYADLVRDCHGAASMVLAPVSWLRELEQSPSAVEQARKLLCRTDLVLYEHEAVHRALVQRVGFQGPAVSLPLLGLPSCPPMDKDSLLEMEQIAFYHGLIDETMDCSLVQAAATRMPQWQFWFTGPVAGDPPAWRRLLENENVRYLGARTDEWPWHARRAAVGMVPLLSPGNGSFETSIRMLATGLPVVCTCRPDSLPADVVAVADDADSFVRALQAQAGSRLDPESQRRRLEAARSYDWESLLPAVLLRLDEHLEARAHAPAERMNVLLLRSGTTPHDAQAEPWAEHSCHDVFETTVDRCAQVPLRLFDAVLLHPSLTSTGRLLLPAACHEALYRHPGFKAVVLSPSSEEEALATCRALGVHAMLAAPCLPSSDCTGAIEVVPSLHGCASPEELSQVPHRPLDERPLLLGYREEFPALVVEDQKDVDLLVTRVREACARLGLKADLAGTVAAEEDPLTWVSRCRAILVVQTRVQPKGHHGYLRQSIRDRLNDTPALRHAEAVVDFSWAVRREACVTGVPRLLQAVAHGTALVLVEGDLFSSLIKPQEHYLELRRDLGNLDAILAQLQDTESLREMAARARHRLIEQGLGLANLVRDCDALVSRSVRRGRQVRLVMGPVAEIDGCTGRESPVLPIRGASSPPRGAPRPVSLPPSAPLEPILAGSVGSIPCQP